MRRGSDFDGEFMEALYNSINDHEIKMSDGLAASELSAG